MEFNEKLQELRKQRGLTQEELAARLFVSRTAISKWESGRGYPGIDSIKAIAKFFSVSIDTLLSTDEVLTIAEEDQRERTTGYRAMIFGLLDLSMALLLVLPLFASREGDLARAVSLLRLESVQPFMKWVYLAFVAGAVLWGILILALQSCRAPYLTKSRYAVSLSWSGLTALLLILGLQPYAAVFTLVMLAIKAFILLKKP